jgi:peptidoglycan/LPS O-acetylase OafA/YrhL
MVEKRFKILDAFRGICAIFVVIFHMHIINSISEYKFFRESAIFVDFFFMLSGFVLAHSYAFKKNLNAYYFIRSRFLRIYPLHAFMLAVFILLETGKFIAYEYGNFTFNNVPFTNSFSKSEILPNLLLIQAWTPFTDEHSFNFPSWSISIEFYTYIIFYMTIIFSKNKEQKIKIWFSIIIISLLLLNLNIYYLTDSAQKGLYCFFGGSLTYILYRKISKVKIQYLFGSIIETALIALTIYFVQLESEKKTYTMPILFSITILLFSFESGVVSKVLSAKIFQEIGKLSYSIYMTHAAILFILISCSMLLQKITKLKLTEIHDGTRFLNFGGSIESNFITIAVLFTVIVTSKLTHKYIEMNFLISSKTKK